MLKGKQIPNICYITENELRVKTNTVKGYDVVTENDCLNLSFPIVKQDEVRVTKGKHLVYCKEMNLYTLGMVQH